MAGFCASVRNGWNEKLTHVIGFVGLIGAVGLAVTKPVLGDAGVVVVTVKFPYVTQDVWMAWAEGWRRRQKRCSMRWWYRANTCMSACFGRKHALGVNTTGVNGDDVTSVTFSANAFVQRRCCTQNYHHQCRKSRETYIECMHIFAYNQQRLSLSQRHVVCRPLLFIRTGGHTFLYRKKKLVLPRHCGFDSYSALTKTRCPWWLGKLLRSNSASLFLSFCLLGIVWSSVKAQSTKKSS